MSKKRKIANYVILDEPTVNKLGKEVEEYTLGHWKETGYQPYGYPFVFKGRVCQTMVIYEDEEE